MDMHSTLPEEDLPEIGADEKFSFACGPEQPCFNRCCSQLQLALTPYDVLRLRRNLSMSSQEFLGTFCTGRDEAETGLPALFLRMIESPDEPCPFVTPAGCAVYEDRPGACRAYPIGRGARLDRGGLRERFFLVREEHCLGFGAGPEHTPREWCAAEGLTRYSEFNDKYMRLLSLIRASRPVDARMRSLAALSLWQGDKFGEFMEKVGLLKQVSGPAAEDPHLQEESLAGEEARLALGMAWLELALFGEAQEVRKKTA